MKKRGSIVLALAACLCFVLLGGQVRAAESLDSLGGNNAADYQPPTNNPQNVPTSNLQTTSTGLQPVPGQTDVNQQNLAGVSNLQVEGTQGGVANPNTTRIDVTKGGKNWLRPVAVVSGITVIIALAYAVFRSPSSISLPTQALSAEPVSTTNQTATDALPIQSQKTQVKKLPKKKSSKKRKAKK